MNKQYKINNTITATEVRLIAEDGKQVGIFSKQDALEYALGQGADLVLIGEGAKPPVAKIVDFKKFLYQEQKKEAEARKGQRGSGTKEVRVGSPFAQAADIEVRVKRTKAFLEKGYNVKIVIKFAGRQMAHPEFGYKIITQFTEALNGIAKLDRPAKFEGKQLVATYSQTKGQ